MAKRLWELFYTFAKVGVMTFGGGYAMLPILQREVVENKGWATEEELADWFAIGQCTPGVIAVNTATFAGRKVLGNIGGVVATLGVVFPSLIIISLLAGVITTFAEVAWVRNAFAGIRVCVCVLIFNAVVKLWKKSVVDKKTLALYAVILLASLLTDLSPVIFVLFAADKTGWFTRAQLADMIAVSESTPGPIGVNMATYVGFLTGGVPGAVTATVGLIAPSVIVILIIAAFLQAFRDSKYVAGAFYGLRPASTALITAAGLVVVRETFWLTGGVLFWQGIILAAVLLVLTRWVRQTKNWHPIVFIGLSALVGVVFRFAGA